MVGEASPQMGLDASQIERGEELLRIADPREGEHPPSLE
jgi:hypothetical protein